jgi:fimbrial isopeptide formation D2 family protein
MLFSLNSVAQVNLVKSASVSSIDVGTPFTYSIQINCPGTTDSCNNVVVTDPLDINLDFIGTSTPTGNVQSITHNPTNNTVTITMNPTLNGTTDDIQIAVAIKTNTADGLVIPNTAYAGPGNTLPSNIVNVTTTNGASYVWSDEIVNYKDSYSEASAGNGIIYKFMWANRSETHAINNLSVVEVIPSEIRMTNIHPVAYYNATGITYDVYFKTNLNSSYRLATGGPYNLNEAYYLGLDPFYLVANEYVTELRFDYLQPIPGGGQFYDWSPYLDMAVVYGQVVNTTPVGTPIQNCINSTGTMNSIVQNVSSCSTVTTSTPTLSTLAEKEILNIKPGYIPGDTIEFQILSGVSEVSGLDFVNPSVIDLLPPELEFISYTFDEAWGEPFGGNIITPNFTKIDDYLGTGQTFLKWDIDTTIYHSNNATGKVFKILLNTRVKPGIPSGTLKTKLFLEKVKIKKFNHRTFGIGCILRIIRGY